MADARVSNLTKSYGSVVAVNDLSFSCSDGEFFTILGPSGAGKTTTLELIAGIKKPDKGEIYIGDRLVTDLPPQERDVAMAFENYCLYPHFNVYDNIAFPLRSPARKEKLSPAEERERVKEIADVLGIGHLLDRSPRQLSGGQKQRVSLARAMVRRPQVYLLDEPIAHLDAKLRVAARSMLKRLANKLGITIIYVTHDYKEALALSDRIMVVREGRIEQIGTPDEVYGSPVNDFVARLIGDPPINLIDGTIFEQEGKTYFRAGNDFTIALGEEHAASAKKAAWEENGSIKTRIGIRPHHVRWSRTQASENSFQLPIYSIQHEADAIIVVFELQETFLTAKTAERNLELSDRVWIDLDEEQLHFFTKTLNLSKK